MSSRCVVHVKTHKAKEALRQKVKKEKSLSLSKMLLFKFLISLHGSVALVNVDFIVLPVVVNGHPAPTLVERID